MSFLKLIFHTFEFIHFSNEVVSQKKKNVQTDLWSDAIQ